MASALIVLAGAGYQAYASAEEGKEAERQADKAAAQLRLEEGQLASVSADKAIDIKRGGRFEQGEAKAFGALGGSKVGTGSSGTLLNRIGGAARRKSRTLEKSSGFQRQRLLSDASEYERRGKNRRRAGKRGAWASLLTGGYQAGVEMSWWGN